MTLCKRADSTDPKSTYTLSQPRTHWYALAHKRRVITRLYAYIGKRIRASPCQKGNWQAIACKLMCMMSYMMMEGSCSGPSRAVTHGWCILMSTTHPSTNHHVKFKIIFYINLGHSLRKRRRESHHFPTSKKQVEYHGQDCGLAAARVDRYALNLSDDIP